MKQKQRRTLSLLLAVVMMITFALPAYAQEIEPLDEIISVSDEYDPLEETAATEAETDEPITDESVSETGSESESEPVSPDPDEGLEESDPTEPSSEEEETDPPLATPTDADSFYLDCSPEEAAEIIAFYEFVAEQIENPPFRPFAADGDTGTVSWSWGETVNMDFPSGVPGNPYHVGNIPRITLSTSEQPIGRPFCVEFGIDPSGTYTASEGGDDQVLSLLVAFEEGSASAVGVQLALWAVENGLPFDSHPQAQSALSAASGVSTEGYTYFVWSSGSGQPFVTLEKEELTDNPTDPSGSEPTEPPPTKPTNPNTRTEVTTDTETRTEIRQSTEYDYADGIGQITITKRDQDGNSLDGAIFRIDIEFASGARGGTGAFEVYNGTRLFTWTHPQDDYQPAKVTVTEIYCPPGYIMDPTPKTAIVHPTYTRITRVMEHTITITTTTTTTSVIDIDTGEVLAESSASADAETELNPPTIQEYTDFIEGDRETDLTFVNHLQGAELVIFKYRSGTGEPLQGAQFEVSYVDPSIDSGRWTVTTGADGKAVIALPKPGGILIHEASPPAGHVITSAGPDTTVTIEAGESKQVDIPNDPYTSVEVTKVDSVTGERLAGATIRLKHITSGMEYRLVTDSNGIALFENVEPGSYYVEEIVAPDRYVLNTTRFPVQLRSHETATVTIPNDPYTGIEITKVDANNGQKLAGAIIRLKHISSGQEYTGETGADGKVYFGKIPPGNYYVEEIQAPTGYVINTTRFPLELRTGELATLTIPDFRKDGLYIRKVDENGKPLAGAVFELRRGSGEVILRETTDQNGTIYRGFLSTDTYIVEEISAPVGYLLDENNPQSIYISNEDDNKEFTLTFVNKKKPAIEIVKVDEKNPNVYLQGAVFRVSEQGGSKTWDVTTGYDGTALLENLEIGVTYLVEEITPPKGYLNSGYREIIVLNECRTHTITVANGKRPGLRIEKIDSDTGRALAGAVFRVASRGGSEYRDVTTGFDGSATISDLEAGWYTVTEIRSPSGYLLDGVSRDIELVAGETARLVVPNSKQPSLSIRKVDEADGRPLAGAMFRVTPQGGGDYTDVTTGSDGVATLNGLEAGWYVIVETRAPTGYLLDDSPHTIEILPGETASVTINNSRKPSITIAKVDAADGKPLAGAVFRVALQGGTEYVEVTSGADGLAVLEGLADGWYVVTELQSPEGYLLDSTPHNIQVQAGGSARLVISNSKRPALSIYKVDEADGSPLAGAMFRVTPQGGGDYTDVTTGPDGLAVLEGLADGWYVVTEIRAPSGYLLNSEPQNMELKAGESASITFTNQKMPSLTIKKVDEDTGEPLPGAVFRVTKDGGAAFEDVTTGSDGSAVVTDLAAGWYVVTELRAPSGYLLVDEPVYIELKPGEDAEVVVQNRRKPSLRIVKLDAVTKQPLQHVTFEIAYKNGKTIGEFTTDENGEILLTDIEPGLIVITETEGRDGYIIDGSPKEILVEWGKQSVVEFTNDPINPLLIKKVDTKTGEPLSGAKFLVTEVNGAVVGEFETGRNGFITVTGLLPGFYTVKEVKSPLGYILSDTPKTVELRLDEPAIVEFENEPLNGLHILKVDKTTGEPLAGAKFSVHQKGGELIGHYTSDRNGEISIDGLEPGWFTITETVAPSGYLIDSAPRDVELVWGQFAAVEITNSRLSPIQIKKVDEADGKPLAGALFRVTTAEGTLIGEFTTGVDGFINVPELAPGTYIISELRAPEGYNLDNTPKTVTVKADEFVLVEFTNKALPGLQVLKVDADTGEPLAGAKFRVTEMDGELVGDYVTNQAGFFVVPELPAGWYSVFETAAPAGYIVDKTPQNVELKPDKTAVVEFSNEALAGLQIKKVDEATGLPMAGVAFSVEHMDGARIGSFTTDENGLIFIPELEEGWIVVTETKTLPGYKLDSAPRNVEIKSGEMNVLELANMPYPFLQITKVDAETGKPLAGVKFKIYDKNSRELGEFTTNELGIIKLTGMEPGTFFVRESVALAGYVLDSTAREVTLYAGKTTAIKVSNTPLATLRLRKIDAVTKKPLEGAMFLLRDAGNNLIGEYQSDANGLIELPRELAAGKYTVEEVTAPEGYVLLEKPVSFELKAGATADVVIPNEPERGRIQIVKKSADDNSVTKKKKGAALEGAVFEIVNEDLEVVDTITTNERGIAESKDLPLGRYAIQEIKAPEHYLLDDGVFYADIKLDDDVVRFEVLNSSAEIGVTVEKRGNAEALPGDVIRYDFSNISNASNVELEEFYWHDQLPADAVRLEKLFTGTWSEKLSYKVVYRTNLKKEYRTWEDKLSTTVNNELDVAELALAENEYVTDFRVEFGTVEAGFHETEAPFIMTKVLPDLPDGHRFVNKTDVSGTAGDEETTAQDFWVTVVFAPSEPLPKTGF